MYGRLARYILGVVALGASLAMVTTDFADARAGRGGSAGSRGSNTYSAPPTTNTAPKAAAPIEKSMTQPGKANPGAAAGAATAGKAAAATSAASRFGGWKGILMGGLIGFALASFLGPGALASILGGMLWFGLLALLAFLVVGFVRNRMGGKPALAQAGAAGGVSQQPDNAAYRTAMGGVGGAGAPALQIQQDDFNAFERLLGEIQTAYGRGDVDALGVRATPEMTSYFAHELEDNRRNGVRNELSGVKLLQGDLAESWREGTFEYATVAMRYAIVDAVVEVKSGNVVSGSRTQPQEVTEVWTFTRPTNGTAQQWELSAIQQA